jgi:catechol-2,3-dioxygenase
MADVPQLFRLNIEVGDLTQAQAFYEALLGLQGRAQPGSRFYMNAGAVALQVVDVTASAARRIPRRRRSISPSPTSTRFTPAPRR